MEQTRTNSSDVTTAYSLEPFEFHSDSYIGSTCCFIVFVTPEMRMNVDLDLFWGLDTIQPLQLYLQHVLHIAMPHIAMTLIYLHLELHKYN